MRLINGTLYYREYMTWIARDANARRILIRDQSEPVGRQAVSGIYNSSLLFELI